MNTATIEPSDRRALDPGRRRWGVGNQKDFMALRYGPYLCVIP
jgi:hypothetical protein